MSISHNFTSSADVFAWISGFINFERSQIQGKQSMHRTFRLDRMELLCDLAGRPDSCAPVIHIAGSKGKGSVTGMTAAILEAGGIKTACYASPHVSDYRERISRPNGFFEEAVYLEAGRELRELTEDLQHRTAPDAELFNPESGIGEAPTFFELFTLLFFLCARISKCDAMAVETGIGGRLDATNIVHPLVSAITPIELEHTEYLGDTIAAIAGEKAGIIKQGKPLLLSDQTPEALEVFRLRAEQSQSPLVYFPDAAELNALRIDRLNTAFTLRFKKESLFPKPLDLSLPIPGAIQACNAGLAVLTAKTAFPLIGEEAIRKGLASFRLPARFEKILEEPPLVIDGAHTAHSAALCADTFAELYGDEGILLFGCAKGKDAASMAKALLPHFSQIIITLPGTFKKSDPDEVYAVFKREAFSLDGTPEIRCVPETNRAIETALKTAAKGRLPILGTGSFYLAAEIRERILHLQV
ncbi:MAG: tetrahydrofolate synthase [Treponema sp.]|jgi:dihydrofolate synthase/folylpolyglutamate synthase|nr:tetrahydrofolate synthase [Treponema sp.]